ncbi:hypothetical protein HEK131_15920 [Streptomyces seoulensis]|nr:hypothetical protein HEK131_15920 [Streptomyces seoulensis]
MVHGGQDGPGEYEGDQGDDRAGQVTAPGEDEQDDREHRHEERPPRGERPEPSDHAVMVAEAYRVRIPFVSRSVPAGSA